jgi:hypothetical protein
MENTQRAKNSTDYLRTNESEFQDELDRIINRARDENEALQNILDKMVMKKKNNIEINNK